MVWGIELRVSYVTSMCLTTEFLSLIDSQDHGFDPLFFEWFNAGSLHVIEHYI